MGTADDSRSQKQAIKDQGVDIDSILTTVGDIEASTETRTTNGLLQAILNCLVRVELHLQEITEQQFTDSEVDKR